MSCDYILSGGVVTNDLLIAGNLHAIVLFLAVEDDKHIPSLILSGNDIHTLVGDELCHATLGDYLIPLSPV